MTVDPLIQIENLFLSRPQLAQPILKSVNLTVCRGDVYGIIGLSGAGKSSLLRCIGRLQRPTSGRVVIDGIDLFALRAAAARHIRRKIGVIFQHFHLFSSKTVFDNVAYALDLNRTPSKLVKKRVDDLLCLVGLSAKAKAYPSSLSGGEKQRCAIARALANNPVVLLCDEATSALDPKSTASVLRLLQSLNRELDLTVVLVTHEMEVVKHVCNKVAVMEKGEVVEEGLVPDVFTDPHHATTKHFLQQVGRDLPAHFTERLGPGRRLLRLCFKGACAEKPLIMDLVRRLPVDVNILLGGIDCLQSTIIGSLIVELSGQSEEIGRAVAHLKGQGVVCEEVTHAG